MRQSNVMEKKKPMFRLSKRFKHQAKRFCAAFLSVSMVMCHTTVVRAADTSEFSEFEMDSVTLYQAFQKAVAEDEPISDLTFTGETAEDYEALFGQDVYELEPKMTHKNARVDLRVFAKLREDAEISLDHGYQVKDTDEIIFLVTNNTGEEQKAVIYINDEETGNRKTEEFTVAPRSSVSSENSVKASGGSGSSGSGATAEVPSGEVPESSVEETTAAETIDSTESRAEETEIGETVIDEESSSEAEETVKSEEVTEGSSEAGETETEITEGTTEGTTEESTEETTEEPAEVPDTSEAETEAAEDNSQDSGENTAETDSESAAEPEENVEEASIDEGNLEVSISDHRVYRVAEGTGSPSNAAAEEPSDKASEKKDQASPSDAERSVMSGTLYESAELDGKSVRAYVFKANELGLTAFGDVYEAELDDIIVRVSVPMGTFGDDVELAVKKLGEDTAEYESAKIALDDSEEIIYDGMMALDIAFRNGADEEIEPDREARVMIEMKKSALPVEADPESLTVYHLAEDENKSSVEVQVVADVTEEVEGTVEVNEEDNLVVAFSVDSFSTFTITWSGISGEKTANVYYVDENGREITCNSAPTRVNKDFLWDTTVTLSDYAFSIDGYNYQGAHLGSVNGESITQLRGYRSLGYHVEWSADGTSWNTLADQSVIYLVYNGSTPTPPSPGHNQDMAHEKTAVRRNDGTYDLTLTVSGAVGSESQPALLDVIYVVDESNSMTNSRFTSTKNAITGLTNALTANPKIDPRFSVVTFSGGEGGFWTSDEPWNDAQTKVDWTENASSIANVSFSTNGGTNYQAGIRTAKKELLSTKRENAKTAVIFISDGDPTYYYRDNGETTGNGGSYDSKALDAAKTEVSTLYTDYFFTVGVGDSGDYQKLKDLKDAAPENTTKKFFSTSESDKNSLTNAFDEIQDSITTFLCSDVTVTDTLSDNVKIVSESDGNREPLQILVTEESEGGAIRTVAGPAVSPLTVDGIQIEAKYDTDVNGKTQIIMDFPNDYNLKKGYMYQVIAHIEPTETAYQQYRTKNFIYEDTPESGTGTHADSNEKGFYSNGTAEVSYNYKGQSQPPEPYDKPVVQLNPGTLKIEKEIAGLDETHLQQLIHGIGDNGQGLSFQVDFTWNNGASKETAIVPLKELITKQTETAKIRYTVTKDVNGKYTILFEGLSPDTTYAITEVNTDVNGYKCEQKVSETTGNVEKGVSKTVSIINEYTKALVTITITKTVTGNMSNTDEQFDFELSYGDKKERFSLKHGGSKEFQIPAGSTVTVAETNNKGYTTMYQVGTDGPVNGTLATIPDVQNDVTIAFTNEKEVLIPTGLFQNKRPYLLMLLLMMMSAISLLGTTLLKKIRIRKDEDQD